VSLDGAAKDLFERTNQKGLPEFTLKDKLLTFRLEVNENTRELMLAVAKPKNESAKPLLRHLKIVIKNKQGSTLLTVPLDGAEKLQICFEQVPRSENEFYLFSQGDASANTKLGSLHSAIRVATGKEPRIKIEDANGSRTLSEGRVKEEVAEGEGDSKHPNLVFFEFPGDDKLVKAQFNAKTSKFTRKASYVRRPPNVQAFDKLPEYNVKESLIRHARTELERLKATNREEESVRLLNRVIEGLQERTDTLNGGSFPARLSLKLEDGDEFVFSDSLTPNQ